MTERISELERRADLTTEALQQVVKSIEALTNAVRFLLNDEPDGADCCRSMTTGGTEHEPHCYRAKGQQP